jgi:hypothetical protein
MKNHVLTAALSLALAPGLMAADADHVVPLPELHQRAVEAAQARQKNLETMDRFLAGEGVAETLRAARIDPQRVRNAVQLLSDADLARLAERARQAQSDFAAGALNNQELTYIVIALAAAVLVLIVVAA